MSIARKGVFVLGIVIAAIVGCNSHSTSASASTSAAQTSASVDTPPITINPTFQSRNPRPCPSIKHPPSNAEAAALVQCTQDGIARDHIFLLQNVSVSVGASGPGGPSYDQQNIDVTAPIYNTTGSEVMVNCQIVDNIMKNSGKNCNWTESLNMTGYCYRTNSGDWRCLLSGGNTGTVKPEDPPPTTY